MLKLTLPVFTLLAGILTIPAVGLACGESEMDLALSSPFQACLPADIGRMDIVSAELGAGNLVNRLNVAQALDKLQAKCDASKLVDGNGRELKFYRLQGCWGTPPPNANEIKVKQAQELASLRQTYTVVEMTCNPGGYPLP